MSLETTANPATSKASPEVSFFLPEICLGVCLVSLAPLLYYHASGLWERPHFQFFPLAWAAFAFLIWQRSEVQPCTHTRRQQLGSIIWALGLLAGVVAAAFFSPWLAFAATTLCITGWGLGRLNKTPLPRWFAWTLLLWITLPLPGKLDADFINELQRLSSHSASVLLDLLSVPHLRQGTLIEIRDHRLFVDEACSGVDSLYSLIAITLVMLVWSQRTLIVGFFALASVPLWAWLGNVIRLLVIVFLLDQFDMDLSHGWPHTALGICTFAFSSICLLATLRALTELLQRFSLNVIPRDGGTWYRWYNNIVCYPGQSPVVSSSTREETEKPKKQVLPAVKNAPLKPRWTRAIVIIVFASTILGLTGRSMALKDKIDVLASPRYDAAQIDGVFGEQRLPEQIGAARRMTYRTEDRSAENYLGEHSRMWLYRDAIGDIQFSVDFPFRGFHALWICYTNAGHQLEGTPRPVSSDAVHTADGMPAIQQVTLIDELGSYSYLWFVLVDQSGTALSVRQQDETRLRILRGLNTALGGILTPEPVTYQIQMLVTSSRQLSEDELDKYKTSFETALPYAWSQVDELIKQSPQ